MPSSFLFIVILALARSFAQDSSLQPIPDGGQPIPGITAPLDQPVQEPITLDPAPVPNLPDTDVTGTTPSRPDPVDDIANLAAFAAVTEITSSDGQTSVSTNRSVRLDLATIKALNPTESFISSPTVVERGVDYRIIESVLREILKNGSDLLKTNRFTIRGDLPGEESLPGTRITVLQPPTVVESGEHFKKVETRLEYLDYDGSKILKTNSFVEFDSNDAFQQALSNTTVLQWSSHQKRVTKQIPERSGDGALRLRPTTYTELGTGIAYQDPDGTWHDSVPEFELLPDGSVSAQKIQHKVILKANPNAENPVQITLPDGSLLRSRVLGLAYFDRSSGQSVVIATVQDSTGELNEARNELTIANAFQGVSASLRYIISAAGLEQDVILEEQPNGPSFYDSALNPDTSELEVITEFFPQKNPTVTRLELGKSSDAPVASALAEPELGDDSIDFGTMQIGRGKAFSLEKPDSDPSANITKRWQNVDGRTILFEAIPYPALKTITDTLPVAVPPEEKPRASMGRQLPSRRFASKPGPNRALAQNHRLRRGAVLDYALVGTASDVTLSSGTYYIKSSITLLGTTTIQGGAVLKYSPGASMTLSQIINCQTSSSSKAYFVSVLDNTIGETIVPGAPVGTYASAAINLKDANSGTTLTYLEIRNADIAFDNYSSAVHININYCRAIDCATVIRAYNTTVNSTNLSYCGGTNWLNSGNAFYNPYQTIANDCPGCTGDDYGNTIACASPLVLGSPISGSINGAGDEDFFSVTIPAATDLTVFTTGGTDTVGHLLNSSGYELASDDNSGTPQNFRINYPVTAGTYFIRVHHSSPAATTGAYQLSATIKSLVSNISSLGSVRNEYSGWVGFAFTVGSTPMKVSQLGRWISLNNSQSHSLALFDSSGTQIPNSTITLTTAGLSPGQFAYTNLPQIITLSANTTYALMSSEVAGGDSWYDYLGTAISIDPVGNNPSAAYKDSTFHVVAPGKAYVPVDLRFSIITPPPDDYGNSISAATSVALNSSVSGNLSPAGDEDFFRMDVTSSGYLTVYTTGSTDTYGHLLDSAGNEVGFAHNDDNPYPNFSITRSVTPGTYYVRLRSFTGGTGPYAFYNLFAANPPPALPTPTFSSPVFNSDHSAATISATSQAGSTIFYSTDVNNPPTSSYSAVPPVITTPNATVKAIAYQAGYAPSAVATFAAIPVTASVSFSPPGHSSIDYVNGPLSLGLSSDAGSTIAYMETGSATWKAVASGASATIDGIASGSGTVQAYAYAPGKWRGPTGTSGTYYLRVPQPGNSVIYNGSSATATFNTLANAFIDLYFNGAPTPSLTIAANGSGIATSTLNTATAVRAKARKAGYIDSGFTTAHVSQLPAPRIATASGLIAANTELPYGTAIWLLPNFGFDNAYGETPSTTGWSQSSVTWANDVPSPDFPGSFAGGPASALPYIISMNLVPVSYGRTYTMAGYFRKQLAGGTDYAGLINFADDTTPITAEDVNEAARPITTLSLALSDGATTAQVVDPQSFTTPPPDWYYDLLSPLINFSASTPMQRGNQPNNLSAIFQSLVLDPNTVLKVTQVTGNTLSLSHAYHGVTLPPGTPVARRDAGNTYQYQLFSNFDLPLSWTLKSQSFNYLRAGTDYIRLVALLYSGSTRMTGLEFWEGSVSQRPALYYRTDGNPAVFNQTAQTGPKMLTITQPTTLYMAQRGAQYFDSSTVQYNLTVKLVPPQLTTTLNSAGTQLTIIATDSAPGAAIYYTTDGTDPTTSSILYTGQTTGITVPATTTTKWKAFQSGYTTSDTATQLGVPSFNPPGGTYTSGQTVTITAPAGAQLKVLQVNPNLLDSSSWVTGSQGSQTGFNAIGAVGEDAIELRTTPYNTSDKLWVARNLDNLTGPQYDGDGGWESGLSIDKTKLYRFSVWIRKLDTTPAVTSGWSYLGCANVSDLTGTSTDSPNSNPYFSFLMLPPNQWHLLVGYVHPAGDTTTIHSSRVYNSQGQVIATGTDFRWSTTALTTLFRTYFYYCTETGVQQEFWNPRVEQVVSVSDPVDVMFLNNGTSPQNVSVLGSAMFRAYSISSALNVVSSPIATQAYQVSSSQAAQPAVTRLSAPPVGRIKQVNLNASTTTIPQEIHYTIDGTDPLVSSSLYPTAPNNLILPAAASIKFRAFKAGYSSSPVTTSQNQPPDLAFGQTVNGVDGVYADQEAGLGYLLFVQLTGGTGSLTDSDSYSFAYGDLRVEMTSPNVNDQLLCYPSRTGLSFVPSPNPNVIPSEIRDNNGKVGSYVGGMNGSPLIITFDASVGPGLQQDVLLGIAYKYSGTVVSPLARPFLVTVHDGDGGVRTKTGTLNVIAAGAFAVAVGQDQTIEADQAAQLRGYLNSKILVAGGGISASWTISSAPSGGVATFDYTVPGNTSAAFNKPGTYRLRLTVVMGSRSGYAEMNVTVNAAPEVFIQAPSAGQQLPANTSVQLTASAISRAMGGTVSSVQFLSGPPDNPTVLGSGNYNSGTGLYEYIWSKTPTFIGVYSIYAKASDTTGRFAYSAPCAFKVGSFPTVNITAPAANSVFSPAATLTISANASETGGNVDKVEFFEGRNFLDSVADAPFSITKINLKPGNYTLTAKATDNLNLKAISSPVSFSIKNSTASANGRWYPIYGRGVRQDGMVRDFDGVPLFQALALDFDGSLYTGSWMEYHNGVPQGVTIWSSDTFQRKISCNGNICDFDGRVRHLKLIGGNLYATRNNAGGSVLRKNAGDDSWVPVGTTVWDALGGNASVNAIAGLDEDVYIAGDFVNTPANSNTKYVARLSGGSWVPTGDGLSMPAAGNARALTVMGGTLYVGGDFLAAGVGNNPNSRGIAQLVNGTWRPLQTGVNGAVHCLLLHKGILYVGGEFTTAGGLSGCNGIAAWDGAQWSKVGDGISLSSGTACVRALAARGDEIFVGGRFDQIVSTGNPISVGSIARATWNESQQAWFWSALGYGASDSHPVGAYSDPYDSDLITSLAVRDSGSNAYELFAAGNFEKIDGANTYHIARWVSGAVESRPTDAPTVTLSASLTDISYGAPPAPTITLTSTATTARSGSSIAQVEFYANGRSLGSIATSSPYVANWTPPGPGIFVVTAKATDSLVPYKATVSAPITVTVRQTGGSSPIANNDVFPLAGMPPFLSNQSIPLLNVLANDQNAAQIISVFRPSFPAFTAVENNIAPLNPPSGSGSFQVTSDGKAIRYFPNPRSCGVDTFAYTITDGHGNYASATVTVTVKAKPEVMFTMTDGPASLGSSLSLTGSARDADGNISQLVLFQSVNSGAATTQNILGAGPTFATPPVTFNTTGIYTFWVKATDNEGNVSDSAPLMITVPRTGENQPPQAEISSPSNLPFTTIGPIQYPSIPLLTLSSFTVTGKAFDPDAADPVAYQITLVRPDQPDKPIQNLTPAPVVQGFHQGAVPNGTLGVVTLAPVPNGIYYLKLTVRGGAETVSTYSRVQIQLASQPGRLKFSEEDLVLPTAGIPLRVVRTYDSANPLGTDFGPGWTYDLFDLDAEVDEDRSTVQASSDLDDSAADTTALPFNMRVSGGRDVTLNIPGGSRGTFTFVPRPGANCVYAEWKSPSGTTATLRMLNGNSQFVLDNTRIFGPPLAPFLRWDLASETSYENFDIPQYELKTDDGTKYELTRLSEGPLTTYARYDPNVTPTTSYVQPRSGKFQVTKITRSSGEVVNVAADGTHIDFVPAGQTSSTRSMTVTRDAQGRIAAITVPGPGAGATPVTALKYEYNADTGNLFRVYKWDSVSGIYVTNSTYRCENTSFPSYVTSIDDARGIQDARSEYYDGSLIASDAPNNGRLKSITDAKGRTTTFQYPTTGFEDSRSVARVETRDADGNLSVSETDQYANVVMMKNPLGFKNTRTFGGVGLGGVALDPTLLTKEQYDTKLGPLDSGNTTLIREWLYHDPDYPYAPSTVIADYATGTTDSAKRKTITTYNKSGQPEAVYEPLSVASGGAWYRSYRYDPVTRQLASETFTGTDPAGTEQPLVRYVYFTSGSQLGLLNSSVDANNIFTFYIYYNGEAGGKLNDLKTVEVHDGSLTGPTLSKTTYEYDGFGNRTKQTVERSAIPLVNDVTLFTYDAQGRLIQQTDPTLATSETQYNYISKVASTTDRYNATTRYFYDSLGDQTCVRYADGTVTLSATGYVSGERQVTVTDRHFRTSNNQLTTGTRTTYDKAGRLRLVEKLKDILITESTNLGINSTTDPNLANLLCDTSFVSANQATPSVATSTVHYDDGRTKSTTDANGNVTTYQYSGDGTVRTVVPADYTDASGTWTTRIVETSDSNGNLLSTQNITRKTTDADPHTPIVRYSYDQMNRRRFTSVSDTELAGANTVTVEEAQYDWLGRTVRRIDADGIPTRYDYDGLGRLKTVVLAENLANSTTTQYAYDETGNQISQTDAKSHTTNFQYDGLGRRTRRMLPDGTLYEVWNYDFLDGASGLPATGKKWNKIQHVDFGNRILTSVFDSMGRLAQKKDSSGTVLASITYNALAQREKMLDNSGARQTRYAYDDLGRLFVKETPEGTLSYDYFAGGQIKSISAQKSFSFPANPPYSLANIGSGTASNPNGALNSYDYDTRSRLSHTYSDSSTADVTYRYDAVGNIASVKYRNSVETTYTYNSRNQLRRVLGEYVDPNTQARTERAGFDYDHADGADGVTWPSNRLLANSGQRRAVREKLTSVAGYPRLLAYSYDNLRCLTHEEIVGPATFGSLSPAQYVDYGTYDAVGNRTVRTASNFTGVTSQSGVSYNPDDRLDFSGDANDGFDANGNTLRGDTSGDGISDQTANDAYDLENRLITRQNSTATITLTYDGDGNRIRKAVDNVSTTDQTTWYLVDDRNPTGYPQVIEERTAATAVPGTGLPTGAPARRYVSGLDLLRQDRNTGTATAPNWVSDYYGYDALGSVRYLTAGTAHDGFAIGAVSDTYTYDAFGIQIAATGNTDNTFRYTGEQWDADLKQYYLRARYYNPQTGRLWTMDTFEGDQADPLGLHKYLYCGNNPINSTDPSGHDELIATLGNLALQGYVRTATFIATRPILARVAGLAVSAFIASEVDLDALQGLPQFQGLTGFQAAEVRLLDGLKRGPVWDILTQSLRGMLSRNAGLAFQRFLKRTILKEVVAENVKVLATANYEADFELQNALIEAKNSARIDGKQLAAIAAGAKQRGKDFWYVFVERPGEAVIKRIEDAGGKVAWFLELKD